MFRWDPKARSFKKVERSGYSAKGSYYVWGRIVQPGIYAPIGLPNHPLIIQALRGICVFRELVAVVPNALRVRSATGCASARPICLKR